MITRRQFMIGTGATLANFGVNAQDAVTRIVVGFAAGGSTDAMGRLIAHALQKGGGNYIVDNKAGAGGRLAAADVKNATPDGKTILLTPDPMMVIYPHVYRKLPYDPIADFQAVTPIASVPMGIAVGPMVPPNVKTLLDFAKWCRANPSLAAYGSAGAGTSLHFIGVMFARANSLQYTHAPYRGGVPAAQDVLGGQIASCINVISELLPLLPTGKIRILAVSSPSRSRFLADVPTFRESGYPALESQAWFGMFVPGRTPASSVERLNAAVTAACQSLAVRDGLSSLGYDVFTASPKQFTDLVRADFSRWGPIVKATGYSADD